jgi:glycosyltransferase involved in cell wall biosynthesis
VLTREIPVAPNSGRERTLNFIRSSLATNNDISYFQLTSVAHQPRVRRIFQVFGRLLRGLIQKHPCPLQVALFFNGSDFSPLFHAIDETNADAVYFDSVRTHDWLVATRARFPAMRLICDFDDLMSLRFATLLARNLPISLGYFEGATPRLLRNFLQHGFVTRKILAYETESLRQAERTAVAAADAVSVVSATDIEKLRADVGPELASKTWVIPPGVGFPRTSLRTRRCREFIFVGSDSLLQNRLTIEYLIFLWSRATPGTPLRIIGRMLGSYPPSKGVSFAGFVSDLGQVYLDDVIALCPSFIEGGIKTKVLEALGHGVIPVGNALTFQGMGCDPGSLSMADGDMESFVCQPDLWFEQLREAAAQLRDCVYARYSLEAVTEAWSKLFLAGRENACGREQPWPKGIIAGN